MNPPVVILANPQMAENIGAAARVMANFDLTELRLVAPRDGWPQERAFVNAAGADWVLTEARIFTSVAEAIADLNVTLATTARTRETQLPILSPRDGAARLLGAASQGWRCGVLFGAERAGLETSDIALTQGIITMPVGQRFRSLNLAQAVAICSYEWAMAREGPPPPRARIDYIPAEQGEMEGLYRHLETELDAAGFFHPPEKRAGMERNLRVALGRAGLTSQEVRTMRGVVTALSKGRGKVLAKLAGKKS